MTLIREEKQENYYYFIYAHLHKRIEYLRIVLIQLKDLLKLYETSVRTETLDLFLINQRTLQSHQIITKRQNQYVSFLKHHTMNIDRIKYNQFQITTRYTASYTLTLRAIKTLNKNP